MMKVTAATSDAQEDDNKKPRKSLMRNEDDNDAKPAKPYTMIYTAPSIDYCAESFRSQVFFICIWLSLVTVHTAYFSGDAVNDAYVRVDCEEWEEAENSVTVAESFGCHILNAIITWLFVFLVQASYFLDPLAPLRILLCWP